MSDLKLFSLSGGQAEEIPGTAVALEKSLQNLIEANLETLLGVRFLASEYGTGPKHGGRIDSLGLDENGCPVILEYKRSTNENVINQGLYYLDWLPDHKADFQILVMKVLGAEAAEGLDWAGPRLLCIAGGFTKYDEHAVQQINRNIELVRYRRFGERLLALELVNAEQADDGAKAVSATGPAATYTQKTFTEALAKAEPGLRDLYDELRAFLIALGDDVQERTLKFYIAFKRLKNFACVEIQSERLKIHAKLDPDDVELVDGFTRDVRDLGHFGTGDLEILVRNRTDLERAKPLLERSYEAS
ncbi:MAG: DUF91 domain-containing protein [Acidobacteria bacterium]|nr:MAG: DUF91 domain-containing protein [Acidobacteriota bacterium]REK00868.1 MAG: DUF91 domain-containing protein [Acidobacteriota bacterium]